MITENKTKEIYTCEICGKRSYYKDDIYNCESRGIPKPIFKEGNVFYTRLRNSSLYPYPAIYTSNLVKEIHIEGHRVCYYVATYTNPMGFDHHNVYQDDIADNYTTLKSLKKGYWDYNKIWYDAEGSYEYYSLWGNDD